MPNQALSDYKTVFETSPEKLLTPFLKCNVVRGSHYTNSIFNGTLPFSFIELLDTRLDVIISFIHFMDSSSFRFYVSYRTLHSSLLKQFLHTPPVHAPPAHAPSVLIPPDHIQKCSALAILNCSTLLICNQYKTNMAYFIGPSFMGFQNL